MTATQTDSTKDKQLFHVGHDVELKKEVHRVIFHMMTEVFQNETIMKMILDAVVAEFDSGNILIGIEPLTEILETVEMLQTMTPQEYLEHLAQTNSGIRRMLTLQQHGLTVKAEQIVEEMKKNQIEEFSWSCLLNQENGEYHVQLPCSSIRTKSTLLECGGRKALCLNLRKDFSITGASWRMTDEMEPK